MTRQYSGAGPGWPPPEGAYDYLTMISWRDWAWEGLRRNEDYQATARAHADGWVTPSMEGGALLTHMRERMLPAEAWALLRFC
jgi:transcriptional regulator